MKTFSWSDAAPETERTWSCLSPDVLEQIACSDEKRLAVERARVAPHVAPKIMEAKYSIRNRFRYWELLIRAMETGWGPDGHYFIDEYLNNLDSRDGLDETLRELPASVSNALGPLLGNLDMRFNEVTVADGGDEMRRWSGRMSRGEELSQRWYRRPKTIPWL